MPVTRSGSAEPEESESDSDSDAGMVANVEYQILNAKRSAWQKWVKQSMAHERTEQIGQAACEHFMLVQLRRWIRATWRLLRDSQTHQMLNLRIVLLHNKKTMAQLEQAQTQLAFTNMAWPARATRTSVLAKLQATLSKRGAEQSAMRRELESMRGRQDATIDKVEAVESWTSDFEDGLGQLRLRATKLEQKVGECDDAIDSMKEDVNLRFDMWESRALEARGAARRSRSRSRSSSPAPPTPGRRSSPATIASIDEDGVAIDEGEAAAMAPAVSSVSYRKLSSARAGTSLSLDKSLSSTRRSPKFGPQDDDAASVASVASRSAEWTLGLKGFSSDDVKTNKFPPTAAGVRGKLDDLVHALRDLHPAIDALFKAGAQEWRELVLSDELVAAADSFSRQQVVRCVDVQDAKGESSQAADVRIYLQRERQLRDEDEGEARSGRALTERLRAIDAFEDESEERAARAAFVAKVYLNVAMSKRQAVDAALTLRDDYNRLPQMYRPEIDEQRALVSKVPLSIKETASQTFRDWLTRQLDQAATAARRAVRRGRGRGMPAFAFAAQASEFDDMDYDELAEFIAKRIDVERGGGNAMFTLRDGTEAGSRCRPLLHSGSRATPRDSAGPWNLRGRTKPLGSPSEVCL